MRTFSMFAILLALARPVLAGPYSGSVISTATGRQTDNISGYLNIAKSSATPNTPTIRLDGPAGSIVASSGTFLYGVLAATVTAEGALSDVSAHGTSSKVRAYGPGTTQLQALNNAGDEGIGIQHTSGDSYSSLIPYSGAVPYSALKIGINGVDYVGGNFTIGGTTLTTCSNGSVGFNTPAPNSGSGYPVTGGTCYGGGVDGPQVWFNNNITMFGRNLQPSHPNGIVFIGMSQDPTTHPNILEQTSPSNRRYGLYVAPSFAVTEGHTNQDDHYGINVDAVVSVSTDSVARVARTQQGIYVGDGAVYGNATVGTRYGLHIGTQTIGSVNYGIYDESNLTVLDQVTLSSSVTVGRTLAVSGAATLSSNVAVGQNLTVTGTVGSTDDITMTKANGAIGAHGTNATISAYGPGTQNLKVLNDSGDEGLVLSHTAGQSYSRLQSYSGAVVSPSYIALDGGATGNVGIGTTVLPSTFNVNGSFNFGAGATKSTGSLTGGLALAGTLGVTGASTLSSTLGVTGATTLNSTVVSGANLSRGADGVFDQGVGVYKQNSGGHTFYLMKSTDGVNYSALALTFYGAATAAARIWQMQTIDQGLANAGSLDIQPSGGAVGLQTTVSGGTQLFYCNGGTFTGNLCRGAACICTGGTATALGIYVK